MSVLTTQDVFRETLRICRSHLRDEGVACLLKQAENAVVARAGNATVVLCLQAARAAGEAESRQRRLAMEGG